MPISPLILQRPVVVRPFRWRIASLALALGVPLALWFVHPPGYVSAHGWHAALIVLGAAIAWLLEPVPDFVVALAMAGAWGLAGVAPVSLAFAGFASSSWILALCALTLTAAMARSGLLFRAALAVLRTFPATHTGQVLALLFGGLMITPLVPLATGRVATSAPLAHELARALGYPPRTRSSAALWLAALIGYGGFSAVFLTGLATNFFVLDLLPPSDRLRFNWATWFFSAAPAGVVLVLGAIFVLLMLFRADTAPTTTPDVLRRQEHVLGPMSSRERLTLVALGVLLLGFLLQPLMRIETAWLAIGALVIAMADSQLDRDVFRASIDWGFLVQFGVLLGAGGVLRRVGVDVWIAEALRPLADRVGSAPVLIILLAIFVVACRLVLPRIPAMILLGLAFVPAAPRLGLEPWILGFVVLLVAHTWLHPCQSDFCRLTGELTAGELFTERHAMIAGFAMTLVTLLAIVACLPYWRAIGLLGR